MSKIDLTMREVVENLKAALNIKTDSELEKQLRLSPMAIGKKKTINSIPYKNIAELCFKKGIDLNAILYQNITSKERAKRMYVHNSMTAEMLADEIYSFRDEDEGYCLNE